MPPCTGELICLKWTPLSGFHREASQGSIKHHHHPGYFPYISPATDSRERLSGESLHPLSGPLISNQTRELLGSFYAVCIVLGIPVICQAIFRMLASLWTPKNYCIFTIQVFTLFLLSKLSSIQGVVALQKTVQTPQGSQWRLLLSALMSNIDTPGRRKMCAPAHACKNTKTLKQNANQVYIPSNYTQKHTVSPFTLFVNPHKWTVGKIHPSCFAYAVCPRLVYWELVACWWAFG